jgi:hypothetical protein
VKLAAWFAISSIRDARPAYPLT